MKYVLMVWFSLNADITEIVAGYPSWDVCAVDAESLTAPNPKDGWAPGIVAACVDVSDGV